MRNRHILITCAHPGEARHVRASALLCRLERDGCIQVVVTGEGKQPIRDLLDDRIDLVLNAGICGGISPDMKTGMLVLPTRLSYTACTEIQLPGESSLRLRTVDRPVLTRAEKEGLDANVVDMEAYHQAVELHRLRVPFSCLKIVADTVETEPDPVVIRRVCVEAMRELTKSVENAVKNLVNCH